MVGRLALCSGESVRMLKERKGREMKQATSQVRPTARYEWPAAGDQPVGCRISWWRSREMSTMEKMDTVTDMHWTNGVTWARERGGEEGVRVSCLGLEWRRRRRGRWMRTKWRRRRLRRRRSRGRGGGGGGDGREVGRRKK